MLGIVCLLSALIAYVTTKLSVEASLRRGVLDVPNLRSSHSQPVPRLGGIGILIAVAVCVIVLGGLRFLGMIRYPVLTRDVQVMLVTGVGMAAAGLYDDLHGLPPARKFLLQFVLAGAVVGLGFRIESVSILSWGPVTLGVLSIPVTVMWLTGFANIFNFMDGINGISALTAIAYFTFFSVFAWWQGQSGLTAVAIVLVGGCLGFLPHNFPAARTFMGDNGSLLLGTILAFYVVRLAQQAATPTVLVALVLVCSIYLWDSGFTLLRRLRRRENIFQAHRSHLYQRLVQLGHSHARITGLYFLLHVLVGGLALVYLRAAEWMRGAVLIFVLLTCLSLTLSVYWLEHRAGRSELAGTPMTPESSR